MNAVDKHYQELLTALRESYIHAACTNHWGNFKIRLRRVLQWADAASAASVRQQLTGKKTKVNSLDIDTLIKQNQWLKSHSKKTISLVKNRTDFILNAEMKYWETRGWYLASKTAEQVAEHRLSLIYRLGTADVRAFGQQTALTNPEIGGRVVMVEYVSVCGRTTRPDHCAMNRFLAVPTWEGWQVAAPPNGYGCLCSLIFHDRDTAAARGWLLKSGKPKFEFRWPSSAARRNWELGEFPDPGWTPKPWAWAQ